MILAILQARVSSTRLPGKVLAPILGQPMIIRQIERVMRSSMIDKLVVATSSDQSDDALVSEFERHDISGLEVRRGSLDDVVARFGSVIDEFDPTTIVRLTADCPLADVDVIDTVIRSHLASAKDYTSNTIHPTYPDGLDVEALTADAWRRLMEIPLTPREREHVTLGLYGRTDEFTINSVTQLHDRSAMRWTVDVPDDLTFVRSVYDKLYHGDPEFGQEAIVELLRAHPDLNRTERDLARNAALASE